MPLLLLWLSIILFALAQDLAGNAEEELDATLGFAHDKAVQDAIAFLERFRFRGWNIFLSLDGKRRSMLFYIVLPLLVELVSLLSQLFPSHELVFERPDWLVTEEDVLNSFLRL